MKLGNKMRSEREEAMAMKYYSTLYYLITKNRKPSKRRENQTTNKILMTENTPRGGKYYEQNITLLRKKQRNREYKRNLGLDTMVVGKGLRHTQDEILWH